MIFYRNLFTVDPSLRPLFHTTIELQGRKFMEGPAAEVRTDPRIRQAYLGGNIQLTAA